MEQLTPEERIAAYRYCLDHVDDNGRPWICIHLMVYCRTIKKIYHSFPILDCFPEFKRHKPKKLPFITSTMWWDEDEAGINKRKEVLTQCIEECLLLINQSNT